MKKREAILIVIAVIVTALAYFNSKQTEKRVQEFIEQKESKEDQKLKLTKPKDSKWQKQKDSVNQLN